MSARTKTFTGDFRQFFVRGLAILLPSALTLWIVVEAYLFLDSHLAEPINRGIRGAIVWVVPRTLPEKVQPDWFNVTDDQVKQFRQSLSQQGSPEAQSLLKGSDASLKEEMRLAAFKRFWEGHWYFRFIGLVVAIVLVYLAGVLLGGLLGRSIAARIEAFLTRIPIIKQVYPHVKQLVDLVFGERQIAFRQAVLIEFPRPGTWTLGFVTGAGLRTVSVLVHEDVVTVFVPHSPAPISGFTMVVKRSEVIELDMTVDEALRFVLTAGVLVPEKEVIGVLDRAGRVGPGAGLPVVALSEGRQIG